MTVADVIIVILENYLQIKTDPNHKRSVFHVTNPPSITLNKYIKRLEQNMKCSPETFILALIYLDRVSSKQSNFAITHHCIHRLFLLALVIAAKFFEDDYYKNSYYSNVGGISTTELNSLELELLTLLEFDLFVSAEDFTSYAHALMPEL